MIKAPVASVLVACLALAILYRLFPGLDLWVAGWFYSPTKGFHLETSGFAQFVYGLVPVLKWLFIGAAVLLIILWVIRRQLPFRIEPRAFVLAVGTVALGAGVLGNIVFKDHWGRARPAQVAEFGGGLKHSPPLVISGQCSRNCSFVSGHAAFIFGAFGLALAFRNRRARMGAFALVAVSGSITGLGRMMQGGHFFSDILFAGLLCLLVALILRTILDRWGNVLLRWLRRAVLRLRLARVEAAARISEMSRWATLFRPPALPHKVWVLWGVFALVALGIALIDRPLAIALQTGQKGALSDIFRYITLLGQAPIYLILFGLCVVGFGIAASRSGNEYRKKVFEMTALRSAFLFACVALMQVLNNLIMIPLGRARPAELFADGTWGFFPFSFSSELGSMPSGHTAVAVALALGLISLWPRFWALFGTMALLVAISRIWLTMHYFSDVVVATLIAVGVVVAIREAFRVVAPELFPSRSPVTSVATSPVKSPVMSPMKSQAKPLKGVS